MIHQTRADLHARLREMDEEREAVRSDLARLDAALASLGAALERARPAEEAYVEQHRRCVDELTRLAGSYGLRYIDHEAGRVDVVAGTRAVPSSVRRRITELCGAIRQLDVDRQGWLRAGGRTVAGVSADLEQCRIARAITAARLAALEG